MADDNRWLLPEGIEELLPQQAEHLDRLRRRLIDLFHCWGYELVITPLIEYVESLLVGTGRDLDLQTYKIIDQITGRLMGVRADITPQVARIDAHRINEEGPTRLCYVDAVLHTREAGFSGTRSPIQVGAELYGHAGVASDVEVLSLMVEALSLAGIQNIYVDLGHVGIFRGLADAAGLAPDDETALFDAMQRKAKPDMAGLLRNMGVDRRWADTFLALADLNGDESVLGEARTVLAHGGAPVLDALDELEQIAAAAKPRLTGAQLHFDLAELRGYHYKTGVVFAALVPGHGQEIARGGRYDEIGSVFGRARPATGFSTDLNTLVRLSGEKPQAPAGVLAPADDDPALQEQIRRLRAEGTRVVSALPGQTDFASARCDRRLQRRGDNWELVPL